MPAWAPERALSPANRVRTVITSCTWPGPVHADTDHDDHGSTGAFAGIFLWLGLAIGLFGLATTLYSLSGLVPLWSVGEGVVTDGLVLGALFVVMGVGFGLFAVMIGREGWAAPAE